MEFQTSDKNYLLFWQRRSVEDHAANDVALDVIASNQLTGITSGDIIWIVTLSEYRELFLAGRMFVGEVVEYEEAFERMPEADLWQAEYYAFPVPGTEEFLQFVPLDDLAAELRFDGVNDRFKILEGKLNPKELREIRKLTPESSDALDEAWRVVNSGLPNLFGKNQSALESLENFAVEVWENPSDPRARFNLGVALAENERHEEAITQYRESIALAVDPSIDSAYSPMDAYYNLGCLFLRLGRHEEGIAELSLAVLSIYDFAPSHFMLGVAYAELERFEEAVVATEQGLEFCPDDENAQINLGLFKMNLRK